MLIAVWRQEAKVLKTLYAKTCTSINICLYYNGLSYPNQKQQALQKWGYNYKDWVPSDHII